MDPHGGYFLSHKWCSVGLYKLELSGISWLRLVMVVVVHDPGHLLTPLEP